ncbi:MAG: zinc-binding dehydrogenase [Chloroflexi bacterium]|nr:zinc-binding dehydrogenase [Chloroflexota bacterium]
MKAILYDQPGDPLRLGDAPDPQPGAGELLVRVHAAALNRADLLQRRGGYAPPPGASPILGLELAGEVVQGVDAWKPGDRVMAVVTGGGYAEYAVVPAGVAMRIPEKIGFEEAAAIPEAFLTAYLNLFQLGGLHGHESILIHAGGSGVGSAAIQLAHAEGAFIFTTAGSAAKLEHCRQLGANVMINYKTESFAKRINSVTDGRGVSIILDFVGAPYWNDNLAALATGGKLMLIGFLGGTSSADLNIAAIMTKRASVVGTTLRATPLPQKVELTEAFGNYALPLFDSAELQPIIDKVFSLAEAEKAHEYMLSNANFGKIVLRVI